MRRRGCCCNRMKNSGNCSGGQNRSDRWRWVRSQKRYRSALYCQATSWRATIPGRGPAKGGRVFTDRIRPRELGETGAWCPVRATCVKENTNPALRLTPPMRAFARACYVQTGMWSRRSSRCLPSSALLRDRALKIIGRHRRAAQARQHLM